MRNGLDHALHACFVLLASTENAWVNRLCQWALVGNSGTSALPIRMEIDASAPEPGNRICLIDKIQVIRYFLFNSQGKNCFRTGGCFTVVKPHLDRRVS